MAQYIGGIDAGGTTFKCGLREVGNGPDAEGSDSGQWIARQRIRTTSPDETVAGCVDFFRNALAERGLSPTDLRAIGLASFGPLNLDADSDDYGSLLGTPKPGWSGFPIRQAFMDALDVSVVIDTDVNAALIAEMRDGAAQGAANAAYVTIGTGIGAGVAVAGQLVGRPGHPEFGHVPVSRAAGDADFTSSCSYHADCLEGMASVTALRARFGDPVAWDADHPGWEIAADYLAQACRVIALTTCTEVIVLGGGLMTSPYILAPVRRRYVAQMAGYLDTQLTDAETMIVTPQHGDDAGLLGALRLALD